MTESAPLPSTISAYVRDHCTTCAYGWTRQGQRGVSEAHAVIYCLLNREPVWEEMTDCDRYESREPSPPRA